MRSVASAMVARRGAPDRAPQVRALRILFNLLVFTDILA